MQRIVPVVLAIALTAPVAARAEDQGLAPSRSPVYVTVTDSEKRLVPDLTQDDFEILDNGKPQTINVFENKPTPITTVVMLDTSGSMTASLGSREGGRRAVPAAAAARRQGAGRRVQRQDQVPSGQSSSTIAIG